MRGDQSNQPFLNEKRKLNKLGDKKIKKIITLYEALYDMAGQNKSK